MSRGLGDVYKRQAKERARMEQAKGKKQPKAKEREKPAKDDDSLTTDESEESSK